MNLKENLFWEKYRPNSLIPEKGKIPIILLPRIRKIVEKELQMNFMFVGSGGLGKSTLAGILTENYDTLRINCSVDNGIEIVREEISEHCKNFSISFRKNKKKKGDPYGVKAVWLEEFDNTTPDMRKALRGFIEEHTEVRFIAIVNNVAKLQRTEEDKALLSRFNLIQFDPENQEEINYLKKQQLNYLKSICKSIKFETTDEILNILITRTFPNFRSTVQLLQEVYISGDLESYLKKKDTLNENVYSFIMNGRNNLSENFFYVSDNFPREKTEDLLNTLSRPFFKYLLENHENIILKNGFKILDLTKNFNSEYTITIDPEMHLVTFITKLKELVNI
ncbi:MAG: hypothetical protein HPY57_16135 [Ignavibacteria bacterium]|nr:hypothetical protein [Ignavibacteria bacterium]